MVVAAVGSCRDCGRELRCCNMILRGFDATIEDREMTAVIRESAGCKMAFMATRIWSSFRPAAPPKPSPKSDAAWRERVGVACFSSSICVRKSSSWATMYHQGLVLMADTLLIVVGQRQAFGPSMGVSGSGGRLCWLQAPRVQRRERAALAIGAGNKARVEEALALSLCAIKLLVGQSTETLT